MGLSATFASAAAARVGGLPLLAVLIYVAYEHPARVARARAQALEAGIVRLYVVLMISGWFFDGLVRWVCGRLMLVHGDQPPRGPRLRGVRSPAGACLSLSDNIYYSAAMSRNDRKRGGVEEHLSLAEAAERMGISERTARRWIKSGKLRAYKPGRDYWIPERALTELVEESEVSPKTVSEPLSFSRWLEERFGHSYLALSEEQIEELFEELSGREDQEEQKRELFSAITAEYLATAKTRNLPTEERVLVRGHHKEAGNKWWLAATASGLAKGVTEEFERSIKEVLDATAESETA